MLSQYGLATVRIDGTVTGKERQRIIDDFNGEDAASSDEESFVCGDDEVEYADGSAREESQRSHKCYYGPSICLLTTKACG